MCFFPSTEQAKLRFLNLNPCFSRGVAGGPANGPVWPSHSVVIQVALGAFHSACANWLHFIFRVPNCFWERWANMKSLRSKGGMWNLTYLEQFNWKLYIYQILDVIIANSAGSKNQITDMNLSFFLGFPGFLMLWWCPVMSRKFTTKKATQLENSHRPCCWKLNGWCLAMSVESLT